jgi:hypothetical protein
MSERSYLEVLERDNFLELLEYIGPMRDGLLLAANEPHSAERLKALREWIEDRNKRRKLNPPMEAACENEPASKQHSELICPGILS